MLDRLAARESTRSFVTQPGLGDAVAPRNVRVFLEKLLEYAAADCRAACGAIFLASGKGLTLRCGEWTPAGLNQVSIWEKALASQMERQQVRLDGPIAPAEFHLQGDSLAVLVNAPLLAGQEVVGCLTLAYPKPATPPADYPRLINNAVSNIGALAHALDDLAATGQKVVQLELFFQIGQSMVSTLDLNQLLIHTTGLAASILNAGAASLLLVDAPRHELIFEVALGERGTVLLHQRMPIDKGIVGWVATQGKPLIVNDVSHDARHAWQFDVQTGFLTHSIICVPMQIKGKTVGVLEVLNKYSGEGFDHEDEQLLLTVAGQAAIAIENARLYQSLREERDRTIKAQETARKELARSLHDGTVQLLAAISMNLEHLERLIRQRPEEALRELDSVRNLTRQATRQARVLLFELRPLILETRGLVPALQSYMEQLASSENFTAHLDVDPLPNRLNSHIERTLFSIVQEAINNIKRHAKAEHVWVRLKLEPAALRVEVEDDGVGFRMADLQGAYDERGSLGLLNMRERSEMLEAAFAIESLSEGRERGTRVILTVPIHAETWATAPD